MTYKGQAVPPIKIYFLEFLKKERREIERDLCEDPPLCTFGLILSYFLSEKRAKIP